MRITIAQLNPTVGDLVGNVRKVAETLERHASNSELVVFSELFLTGYPPLDLLDRAWFIEQAGQALRDVAELTARHPQAGVLIGAPLPIEGKRTDGAVHNSAILLAGGQRVFVQHKSLLPTYDVFDEARYFVPTQKVHVVEFKGEKLGISICEDYWNDPELLPGRTYSFDPISELAHFGATLLVNISASPFHVGKDAIRHRLISHHIERHQIPFVLVNQVGANDELIFDGESLVFDGSGQVTRQFPSFTEHVETIEPLQGDSDQFAPQRPADSLHDALVLGIRDYFRKCGFRRAVLGISGGIDSAVTAALAAKALGAENVLGISMPSAFTSDESIDYAESLAINLGFALQTVSIEAVFRVMRDRLDGPLEQENVDSNLALENLQARIRGQIVMAYSNRFNYLALATGNKSELATGYCTLYGDMAGGLAPLSDVPKTMVYELARYINREREIIPQGIIERVPTAELRANQRDQDTLPPYETLDAILHHFIEDGRSIREIVGRGFDDTTVRWVVDAVRKSEYKRRQAPPGLKVTTKAFGLGRRMPIAAKYRE